MPSDLGVEPAPCDFGAVVFAGSATLGGFEGISCAGTFAVCCITLAAGGAAGDFATGTDLGSLVVAAFFCAGSSLVAFATAFGVSAFAFGTAGVGDSAFGVAGLGDFAFWASDLGDGAFGASALEAESEAFDWMHSQGRQAT